MKIDVIQVTGEFECLTMEDCERLATPQIPPEKRLYMPVGEYYVVYRIATADDKKYYKIKNNASRTKNSPIRTMDRAKFL